MTVIKDKEIQAYCKSASKQCPRAFKKLLRVSLRDSIDAYIEEQPNADMAAITAHFGTPQQFASGFLDAMPEEKQQHILHKTKTIRLCSIIATIVFIIAVTVAVVIVVHANKKSSASYSEIYLDTAIEES